MARGFSTLALGNLVSQVIVAASAPVIAKIYGPAAFGVYGLYVTLVSVLGSASTLRYELAVALPKQDSIGAAATWLSIGIAIGISALTLAVVLLVYSVAPTQVHRVGGLVMAMTLPLAVFLFSANRPLAAWGNRIGNFKTSANSVVIKSLSACAIQLMPAVVKMQSWGLVLGYLAGQFFAAAWLMARARPRLLSKNILRRSLTSVVGRYAHLPKYSAPQALLNSLSQGVPVLLLGAFFNPIFVGHYALAQRVLQSPAQMVTSALHDSLYVNFARNLVDVDSLILSFRKYTSTMLVLSGIGAILVVSLGDVVVHFALGPEWQGAASAAKWLSLWIVSLSANVPSRVVINVHRRSEILLRYDILLLGSRVIAISIGGIMESFVISVAAFSIVSAAFNLYIIRIGYLMLGQEGRRR